MPQYIKPRIIDPLDCSFLVLYCLEVYIKQQPQKNEWAVEESNFHIQWCRIIEKNGCWEPLRNKMNKKREYCSHAGICGSYWNAVPVISKLCKTWFVDGQYDFLPYAYLLFLMQHTSLSPDGKLLVIVGDNPEGILADAHTGKVKRKLFSPPLVYLFFFFFLLVRERGGGSRKSEWVYKSFFL